MRYTNIFFDLDGTVTEPALGITNGFIYSLKSFGIEVENRASLYKYIGPPLQESFGSMEGFDEEKVAKAVAKYREYYSEKGILENDLMPGIKETLEALKAAGCKLYIATCKYELYAKQILEYLNIDGLFDIIAGSDFEKNRDNKADVISYLLESIGIEKGSEEFKKTVMVGDRKFDIEGANIVGIDSIGILYGYGDREEFESEGATYILGTTKELADFIIG